MHASSLFRLALVLVPTLPLGCASESEPPPASSPERGAEGLPDRDPALAHRLVEQEGALLLDVRTPEEFEAGHIEGAVNVPHDQLPTRLGEIESLAKGNKDAPIVVYCRSGRRADIAKESLVQGGFGQVTNLGGMGDW